MKFTMQLNNVRIVKCRVHRIKPTQVAIHISQACANVLSAFEMHLDPAP